MAVPGYGRGVHPIEQLRYVARVSGADAALLVEEAASALMAFRSDPAALSAGVRRLLQRQPGVGALWWMGSRLVTAADPSDAAWTAIAELRSDRTARELAHELTAGTRIVVAGWPSVTVQGLARRGDIEVLVIDIGGQGYSVARELDSRDIEAEVVDAAAAGAAVEAADVVVLEAAAVGDSSALVELGGLVLASVARVVGTPTWLSVPVGRRVAEPYVQTIVERLAAADRVPWTRTTDVVSLGLVSQCVTTAGLVAPASLGPMDAPIAPELMG